MNSFEILKNAVIPELEVLKDKIAANIHSEGKNASGKTIESMQVLETDKGAKLIGRSFFGVLETGRKPGKRPPYENIYQWTLDKPVKAKPIP